MILWLEKITKALRQVTDWTKDGDESSRTTLARGAVRARKAIVAARPVHLPQDYQMSLDQRYVDEVFGRLRENIFRTLDEATVVSAHGQPGIFREFGTTGGKTPYFYLKPLNEKGWLFERSGSGWVITRSEKIVGEDLFLRGVAAWEVANLFSVQPSGQAVKFSGKGGQGPVPRVMSRALGKELLSLPVYQHKLLRELDLPLAAPLPTPLQGAATIFE